MPVPGGTNPPLYQISVASTGKSRRGNSYGDRCDFRSASASGGVSGFLRHDGANFLRKMVGRHAPSTDGVRQGSHDAGSLEGPTPTVPNSAYHKAGDPPETHMVQASDLDVPRCQVRNGRAPGSPAHGVPIVSQVVFLNPNEINGLYLIGPGRQRQNDVHKFGFFSRSALPERQ